MARASGCSLALSTLAATRIRSSSDRAASILVVGTIEDDHAIDFGLAFGERAGFVNDQRIDLGESLQRFRITDEDAGVRAATDRNHDGHRRGESQRAWASNDQHGDCGD